MLPFPAVLKVLHLTVIISVSLSSTIPFSTKTNGYLLVANIGVSRPKTMSFAKCDFGAGIDGLIVLQAEAINNAKE